MKRTNRTITLGLFLLWLVFTGTTSVAQVADETDKDFALALIKAQEESPSKPGSLLRLNTRFVTPKLWRLLLVSAARSYRPEAPEDCLVLYDLAKQVALSLGDQKLLGSTYYSIARTWTGLNELDKAKAAYLESEKSFLAADAKRQLVSVFSDLGTISFIMEDYGKARDYSQEALKLCAAVRAAGADKPVPSIYDEAQALATLGELSMRDGDLSSAVAQLQKSLDLYERLSAENSYYRFYVVEASAALGRVYTSAGDHLRALPFLTKALSLAKSLSDQRQVANLLNSLGFLYMEQEDYAQAIAYFDESLERYRLAGNRGESARVLLNLAVVNQRLSENERALKILKESLQLSSALGDEELIIAAQEGMAVSLKSQGFHKDACDVLREALTSASQINDRMRETELTWRLAEVKYDAGDYDQSAELARTAAILADHLHLTKLNYLANTTLGLSYLKQNNTPKAKEALIASIARIEQSRETVAGRDEESAVFFQHRLTPYHALIDLLVRENKLFEALQHCERAKGRVLLDRLSRPFGERSRVLTKDEKKESDRLNDNIVNLNIRLDRLSRNEFNALLTENLRRDLEKARLEYQAFEDSIHASHADLEKGRRMESLENSLDVGKLRIEDSLAYLEYVVTDEKTYLFVLSNGRRENVPQLTVYPIKINATELSGRVNRFHKMLAEENPIFSETARDLYNLLLQPAASQLAGNKSVCIIPDGPLWNLPFQALRSPNGKYLVEDYAVSYVPSLNVLNSLTTTKRSTDTFPALLAFGNPTLENQKHQNIKATSREESQGVLPDAEIEVNALRQLWGNHSKILTGAAASKKVFQNEAGNYQIIHLATHGILDNVNPMYSRLLLSRDASDEHDDGVLEARDIMNLRLNAELFVLSACESANGKVAAGEGMMGLSWAILATGVRTTVVSQWKVDSAVTSEFMISFYRQLAAQRAKDESKKAEALRQAALEILKHPRYRHPFYWAAFVMVGDGR
jgi:CHAT domain-containing protein/Tfp pilus assembly protein PilF